MKAMSKTIFEFQLFALSVVLAASIQLGKNVNVVSCARTSEKLRLNVPIGSISMEINSETWLGT